MDPWNDASLQSPPINTTLCDSKIDLRGLSNTCIIMKKILSKQSPLHKESALLSRFIYKFDMKFRNDIGYRNMKKVNTALHKYISLNLLKDLEVFLSVVPVNNRDNYLPTRQMLEYLLIRIITFSKIMLRINVCSKLAAIHYMDRIKRGQSHWMSLMPFALLCRIWSFSSVLIHHSCSWYTSFFPYLNRLKIQGLEFLPEKFSLPVNLGQFLDMKNLEKFGRFEWSHKKNVQVTGLLDFTEEEEMDFDSLLDYVKEINATELEEDKSCDLAENKLRSDEPLPLLPNINIKALDEGESISREYFQSFFNQAKDDGKSNGHSIDVVTNKATLISFIAKEELFRNENSKKSLTTHLSFMQWQSLKMSLEKLSESLAKNRKIERKFQKLWKEKCSDYIEC